MRHRHNENKFIYIQQEFLKNQQDFDDLLSQNGYCVEYKFKTIKESIKGQLRFKYFVCISISLLDNKNNITNCKKESKSFLVRLANAAKSKGKYHIKLTNNWLMNIYLKRLVKDAQKQNKSKLFKDDFFDKLILALYNLKNGTFSRRYKRNLEIVIILLFIVFLIFMGLLEGIAIANGKESFGWY